MKGVFFQFAAILSVATSLAWAGPNDVQVSVTRVKLDEQKSRSHATTTTTKQVAYKVVVQNKTFKPFTDLEVKYMIFYEATELGSQEGGRELFKSGKEMVGALDAHKSTIFETTPVELSSAALDGGWYFTSGASNKAKDRVSGTWFRAYANGELVGEYINPTTLSKRQEWKE